MAAILKISFDTLERAIQREHKMGFAEYYKIHASGGKKSLRRVQFDKAMDGNVPMLIWLGKQMLGQTEKVETKIDSEVQGININFGNRSNRDKYKDKDPLIVDGSAQRRKRLMTIDLELSEVYEPIYDMEKEGSQKILLYSPRTSAKSTNLGLLIFLYYEKFRDYDVGIGVDSFNNAGDGVLAEFQSFIEAHGLNRNGQWVFGKNETYKKGRTNVIKTYAVQTNRLEDVNRTKSKKLIRPISLFVMDEVQKASQQEDT